MAAAQDAALQGGAIAPNSMAGQTPYAGVCFLLHGGAGQSAIEPNSIPSEIKQRALPQTRPYDDCVAATYNWAHNKQQLPLDADVLRPVISTMQSQS